MTTRRLLAASAIAVLMAMSGASRANAVFVVTLDTSSINGALGYAVAFSLTDGAAVGDGNNTVILSGFGFGGGSASGAPVLAGDASGSIETSVSLHDSQFSNFLVEGFTPGAALSFTVDLSTNIDGLTPDFFGFSLLLNGTPLATLDDTLGDNLLYFNVDSPDPIPFAWATSDPQVALNAPNVAAVPPGGNAPEPATGFLLLAAATAGGLDELRRKAAARLRGR